MKRFLTITVIVLAVLLITAEMLILLVKSGKINPVDIAITQIDIEVKKDSLDMSFELSIDNPRYLIFQPQILTYTVKMDTVVIAKGEKIFVGEEAVADSSLQLPLTIYLAKTQAYIKKANKDLSKDSTKLNIEMRLSADLFGLGLQRVPIIINRNIRTPKPPSLKIENVEKVNLTLKDLKLRIDGHIINENPWNIKMLNTEAHIDIKDLISGDLTMLNDTIEIEAFSESPFSAMADVDDLELVRDAFKVIFTTKDWPYTVEGTTYLALDDDGDPIKVNIYTDGEMPIQPLRMRK